MENQVCSLDLARKLKELGVKQESLFYYQGQQKEFDKGFGYILELGKVLNWKGAVFLSAFTVAELGEMIYPIFFSGISKRSDGTWGIESEHYEVRTTEADARAKVLIYLIENKLISTP